MRINDFDFLAPTYDSVVRLVFGRSIVMSQKWLIGQMEDCNSVLILGGGTGEILTLLPENFRITYLEKSGEMIRISKNRKTSLEIDFINEDFLGWGTQQKFDCIICPFFLDCFNEINLRETILRVKAYLSPNGVLLVSDFELKSTPRFLSWLMHFFFRISTNLESKALKDINGELLKAGFEMKDENFFHRNMIFSRVYRNL